MAGDAVKPRKDKPASAFNSASQLHQSGMGIPVSGVSTVLLVTD